MKFAPAPHADPVINIARELLRNGQAQEAIVHLEFALKGEHQYARLFEMTHVMQAINRHREAVQRLEQARQVAPEKADIRIELGFAYGIAQDFIKMRQVFSTLDLEGFGYTGDDEKLTPVESGVLAGRILSYVSSGSIDQAQRLISVFKLASADATLHLAEGVTHHGAGRTGIALESFEKVINADSAWLAYAARIGMAACHIFAANSNEQKGRIANAAGEWRRVKMIARDNLRFVPQSPDMQRLHDVATRAFNYLKAQV